MPFSYAERHFLSRLITCVGSFGMLFVDGRSIQLKRFDELWPMPEWQYCRLMDIDYPWMR